MHHVLNMNFAHSHTGKHSKAQGERLPQPLLAVMAINKATVTDTMILHGAFLISKGYKNLIFEFVGRSYKIFPQIKSHESFALDVKKVSFQYQSCIQSILSFQMFSKSAFQIFFVCYKSCTIVLTSEVGMTDSHVLLLCESELYSHVGISMPSANLPCQGIFSPMCTSVSSKF